MEEKQFRCLECDAKLATSEQLQSHNRRHEMSINLSSKVTLSVSGSLSTPSFSKGSLSAGVIGFVDETPTPTRFIRNCEEVGLFQDLQNVNPFDEDFKKAANGTATPSGEATGFEFTFSSSVIGVPGTPSTEFGQQGSRRTKRRYSEQDTLNTPQVFPYFTSTGGCHTLTTNTASMSACLTPTPQNNVNNENSVSGELHQTPPAEVSSSISTTSYNHEEHVSIIAYTSAISQQAINKSDGGSSAKTIESPESIELCTNKSSLDTAELNSQQGRVSSLKTRSKSHLKLDLKNVIVRDKLLSEKISRNIVRIEEIPERDLEPVTSEFPCKRELLERNRAAAHRSRERRKQWIYGLESRCRALETLLAQSQAEVAKLRSENDDLKAQLQNQNNNEVTHLTTEDISIHSISDDAIVIHQTSENEVQSAIQEPLADNTSSDLLIVSPIVLPTVKARRGRPRKGEERRVPILAVPIISNSEKVRLLPKIPILPISQSNKKS